MYFNFSTMPYIAIIGDIKQSKKIVKRSEVQIQLKQVLNEINQTYAQEIGSKFMITLGDEFQGLLSSGAKTMEIVSEIERKMYPVLIRFAIGIGSITTEIDKEMSLGADGPGYYNARKAMEYLKENEKKKQAIPTDMRFEVEGDNLSTTMMLNTVLVLLWAIKKSWTTRQREMIYDMLTYRDSQLNVAKRLNIKQPAVQKSFSNGSYYAYKEALETIGNALEEIRSEDV